MESQAGPSPWDSAPCSGSGDNNKRSDKTRKRRWTQVAEDTGTRQSGGDSGERETVKRHRSENGGRFRHLRPPRAAPALEGRLRLELRRETKARTSHCAEQDTEETAPKERKCWSTQANQHLRATPATTLTREWSVWRGRGGRR